MWGSLLAGILTRPWARRAATLALAALTITLFIFNLRRAGVRAGHAAERLDMQDLRFLAVAVGIQQKSGGNLAEILAGLAKVIRARFKLFRRVKAITAEAKWSGMFLSFFPILALIGINVMQPDYYDEVMQSPAFIPAAAVVAVMLAANFFFMRMMVNIKV